MQEMSNMNKAADIVVAEEQHHIFTNNRIQKRMDLEFNLNNTQILVDVTTIDANKPSNGFINASGMSSVYFPRDASVIAARKKWGKYR